MHLLRRSFQYYYLAIGLCMRAFNGFTSGQNHEINMDVISGENCFSGIQ